jgi:hypothetical protein
MSTISYAAMVARQAMSLAIETLERTAFVRETRQRGMREREATPALHCFLEITTTARRLGFHEKAAGEYVRQIEEVARTGGEIWLLEIANHALEAAQRARAIIVEARAKVSIELQIAESHYQSLARQEAAAA